MTASPTQEAANMAKDRQSKKDWDSANMVMVSFKLFKAVNDNRNDQDLIDWLNSDKGRRSEKIKTALREYITTITTPAEGEKGQSE